MDIYSLYQVGGSRGSEMFEVEVGDVGRITVPLLAVFACAVALAWLYSYL